MPYIFAEDGHCCVSQGGGGSNDTVYVLSGTCAGALASGAAAAIGQAVEDQGLGKFVDFAELVGKAFGLEAEGQVLLRLPETRLREIAATVHSESLHGEGESEGVARVIRNRAQWRDAALDSSNLFHRISASGMYGRSTKTFDGALATELSAWTSDVLAPDLRDVVRGLAGRNDITRGAYFWESTAGLQATRHPWRKAQWVGGADPHYSKWDENFTPVFLWIVDLGFTSFFRYNPNHPQQGQQVYP